MKPSYPRAFDGACALLYISLLLGSASFVPPLWRFLEDYFPKAFLIPYAVACCLLVLLLFFLPKRPLRILVFLTPAALFLYSMALLRRPIERIHFLEYGTLSFFLFRAVRHDLRIPWSYGMGILGSFGVGIVDELLQGILPNRVYDPRDIWINLWAAGVGMAMVASVATPKSV